jgi:hypothetical protein
MSYNITLEIDDNVLKLVMFKYDNDQKLNNKDIAILEEKQTGKDLII